MDKQTFCNSQDINPLFVACIAKLSPGLSITFSLCCSVLSLLSFCFSLSVFLPVLIYAHPFRYCCEGACVRLCICLYNQLCKCWVLILAHGVRRIPSPQGTYEWETSTLYPAPLCACVEGCCWGPAHLLAA